MHIGLGAFHRAHQAWYTAQGGRRLGHRRLHRAQRHRAADELAAQDGLYTLIRREAEADSFEVIDSIVEAHDGNDLAALTTLLAEPDHRDRHPDHHRGRLQDGSGRRGTALDLDDAGCMRTWRCCANATTPGCSPDAEDRPLAPATAAARLVVGLAARRSGDGWPLAIVSCDNLPGNGAVARAGDPGLRAGRSTPSWPAGSRTNVSFVDTSIDRITPRTTDADRATVAAATGFADVSPVVTEPFSYWVLSGDFPAGRPAWEKAGAQFVEDLEPFERRKLWLLNGAHTLLSFAGQLRGHATVAEALADPVCPRWVEDFWDAAAAHLVEPELNDPRIPRRRCANASTTRASPTTWPRSPPTDRSSCAPGRCRCSAPSRPPGATAVPPLRLLAAWCDQLAAQHAAGDRCADANAAALEAVLADASLAAGRRSRPPRCSTSSRRGSRRTPPVATIHALRGRFTN